MKTLISSIRYSPQNLATIVSYAEKQGLQFKGISEALRFSVETLAKIILRENKGEQIEDFTSAIQWLRSKGFTPNLSEKGAKETFRGLSLESLEVAQTEQKLVQAIMEKLNTPQECPDIQTINESLRRVPEGLVVKEEEQ